MNTEGLAWCGSVDTCAGKKCELRHNGHRRRCGGQLEPGSNAAWARDSGEGWMTSSATEGG